MHVGATTSSKARVVGSSSISRFFPCLVIVPARVTTPPFFFSDTHTPAAMTIACSYGQHIHSTATEPERVCEVQS